MNAGSRVALFVTCMVDAMFQEVGKATMHLLERLGYDGDGRCARRVAATIRDEHYPPEHPGRTPRASNPAEAAFLQIGDGAKA